MGAAPRRLRMIFMGSPPFAVASLRAAHAQHEIVAVVTQPDRGRGRGQAVTASAVKVAAEALGLPVLQPETLRRREVREHLASYGAEVFVVAAFGQILSPKLLAVPPLGCINVHASLLPRHRGAAPIAWSVLSGDAQAGITIMQMDAGVDTGAILRQRALPVLPEDTAGSLHDRLAPLGAELLVETIALLLRGEIAPRPQDEAEATVAPMLSKEDGRIAFAQAADAADRRIRAMDPWPGAFAQLGDEPLKLYSSACSPHEIGASGEPGEILLVDDRGVLVACGQGAVWIRELQLPGRRRLPAKALAAGRALAPGMMLR